MLLGSDDKHWHNPPGRALEWKVTGTFSDIISKELRDTWVPICLRSVGINPNESWRSNVCQSCGLTDKWLEPKLWGCGCVTQIYDGTSATRVSGVEAGSLPSVVSICWACVDRWARFLNLALIGYRVCTFPLYGIFFFLIYAISSESCWLTAGPSECYPLRRLKLGSQMSTTKAIISLLK